METLFTIYIIGCICSIITIIEIKTVWSMEKEKFTLFHFILFILWICLSWLALGYWIINISNIKRCDPEC